MLSALVLLLAVTSEASLARESWKLFRSSDERFTIAFPTDPTVANYNSPGAQTVQYYSSSKAGLFLVGVTRLDPGVVASMGGTMAFLDNIKDSAASDCAHHGTQVLRNGGIQIHARRCTEAPAMSARYYVFDDTIYQLLFVSRSELAAPPARFFRFFRYTGR